MSIAGGVEAGRSWMPIEDFRAFRATRPDEEGWELVDGAPVMMTPTSITHARIAGNVERPLSDALDAFDPRAVSDQLESPRRFQPDETALDSKLERIRQRRKRSSRIAVHEIGADLGLSDHVLPTCGLACTVADLCRGTPLLRGRGLP